MHEPISLKISAVTASRNFMLRITWQQNNARETVEEISLNDLIFGDSRYSKIRTSNVFVTATPTSDGTFVEWPNTQVDISAAELAKIADENPKHRWQYTYDEKPITRIASASQAALESLESAEYAVLVGRNNCGKSFLLKTLAQQWGENASYLGPARYQNFNLLGYYTPRRNRKAERWRQFLSNWNNQQENMDNSPINLQQAISELSDDQRTQLKEIIFILLRVNLDILQTVPENSMSQKYISCDGHNLSFTSSGFRLIMTLVVSLLDDSYEKFLIDEPELGISPEAQGILADFLFDASHRAKYFPHIKTLILATHSTIFLDRKNLSNNYQIQKAGNDITVSRVTNYIELNQIHFFLLGNRFETLYLPSSILLVEGKTDYAFIERVLNLRYPNSQLSVVPAHSDTRIKEVLNVAKGLLTDLRKSPYRDRILIVLDSVHSKSLPKELNAMGVPEKNIITWSQNGIEYLYPNSIIDKIFGGGEKIEIQGDVVSRNGNSYSKAELVDKVVSLLTKETSMHEEFSEKLLVPLDAILNI